MKNKISGSQLEALIKKTIQEKGLTHSLSEEKISEIKNNIKNKLTISQINTISEESNLSEQQFSPNEEVSMPVQTSQVPTPAVTQQTSINDEANEIAKKEGALETREELLYRKEEELKQKEEELRRKEEEMSYKPQMPDFIEKAEPEKLFIFDMNELSLGSESLMKMPYHTVESPEEKVSMHDLWLQKGKVRAEIFQVEFKKIGEMVFRPLDGICKFEHHTEDIPTDIPTEDRDSVKQAIMSQQAVTPMIDTTEPVTDVTLPLSDNMGLQSPDVSGALESVINKALAAYLQNK